MTTVYVKKINESNMMFDSDEQGVIYEISEAFSFFAPGYKYDRRFRNHMWDGRIHLANARTRLMPLGLIGELKRFCEHYGYDFVDQTEQHMIIKIDPLDDFDSFVSSLNLPFEPRDYQIKAVKHAIEKNRATVISPTGCHAKGSKVLMSDGTFKTVEDVVVGDRLIGYNGQYRTVLKLCRGKDVMYRITPNRNRAKPFIVNGEHILALHNTKTKELDCITVNEYLNKSNWYKHIHHLELNAIPLEFESSHTLDIDPYFMGIYLGDGHTHNCAITTMDEEVKLYAINYVMNNFKNLKINVSNNGGKAFTYKFVYKSGADNPLANAFRNYGINITTKDNRTTCSNKFIPEEYLTSSVCDRMELLAGLIDTDGNLSTSKTYYEYSTKSEQLGLDIQRLAQSLGFVTNMRKKNVNDTYYYRITIMGDLYLIPCKVSHKKSNRISSIHKNEHYCGFTIEELGEDNYYGFMLDGDHLYYNDDCVLNHNSGKSLIIYLLIRWHLKYGRRFCLIVPTVSLVEQMRSDFENYAKNDPSFNVDEVVQTIGGKKSQGKIVDENKSIITTWQSLQHYDSSFYNSFDVMYVDEAHQATASVLQKIYSSAVNVPYRCGFTGSLDEEKIHHLQLVGSLGDIFVVTTTKELQDNGTLSPLKIHMITCKYPEDESKAFYRANKKDYKAEIDYLNSHLKRNMFIRNIVLASKGTTMLLFNFKVHGAELSRLITEKVKEDGIDRKVFFIDGNVSADEREKIRQAMNEENGCILISSVGTTATGLNIPSIQNVILCPSKSKIRNIQSIGRGLRNDKSSGKESCTVYDLVDDMSYGRHKNYCLKHAMDRLRQYQEQQFDIDFHTVKF